MGLDTTHDCWSGPYSSFNRFRKSLATQIGIDLSDYYGYGGHKDLQSIDHPLMPLFDHSDCEGILTVTECKSIVAGFNLVLANFNNATENDYDFIDKITRFKDGCLHAIQNNQVVEFH